MSDTLDVVLKHLIDHPALTKQHETNTARSRSVAPNTYFVET